MMNTKKLGTYSLAISLVVVLGFLLLMGTTNLIEEIWFNWFFVGLLAAALGFAVYAKKKEPDSVMAIASLGYTFFILAMAILFIAGYLSK